MPISSLSSEYQQHQVIGVVEKYKHNETKIELTFTDARNLKLHLKTKNNPLGPSVPIGVPVIVIYNGNNQLVEITSLDPNAKSEIDKVRDAQRQAIQSFTERLDGNPRDADTLCARAGAHMLIGEFDKAIGDYNSALEIRSDDPGILYRKGLALKEKHRSLE